MNHRHLSYIQMKWEKNIHLIYGLDRISDHRKLELFTYDTPPKTYSSLSINNKQPNMGFIQDFEILYT